MGWQDGIPLDEPPTAAAKPRWASAPALDEPVAPPGPVDNADLVPTLANQMPGTFKPPETPREDFSSDPIVNMWAHGLDKIMRGGVPAALGVGNQLAGQVVSGLTAPFIARDAEDAAGFVNDFQSELWRPQGAGGEVMDALGEAFEPMGNIKRALGETTLDATGSPAAATFADMLPDFALTLVGGPKATRAATERPPLKPTAPPPETPVTRAREAGYKIRPSDAERIGVDTPGGLAETFASRDLKRDLTLDNQKNTNKLAAEELGVPPGQRLDDATYDKLEEPHLANYEAADAALVKVPPPVEYVELLDEAARAAKLDPRTNPSTTKVLSALRRRGFKNKNSDVVATQDAGLADLALAEKLEEAFAKRLEALGEDATFTNFQQSRQALAKIHEFRGATRGGQVDADALRKINEKSPGKMTGRGKIIAETAEHFPSVTRSSLSGAGEVVNKSERTMTGLLHDVIAGMIRNTPGLSRFLDVGSDAFQNRLGTAADDARRSYFGDYGVKPKAAPEPPPGPQGDVPFTPPGPVTPPAASRLSEGLELEPDPVRGAQQFDPPPDFLTADTPPAIRGDLDFAPSRLSDELLNDIALETAAAPQPIGRRQVVGGRDTGRGYDFGPSSVGDLELDIRSGTRGAIGERELSDLLAAQRSDGLEVAPPREMEQLDMPVRQDQGPGGLQLTKAPSGKGPKVEYEMGDVGDHYVTSKDGSAVAQENGNYLQLRRIDVAENGRRTGQGRAMMGRLLAEADNAGLTLASDVSVSAAQAALYRDLAKRSGRELVENPHTVSPKGSLISKDPRKPVFEIAPKEELALGDALTGTDSMPVRAPRRESTDLSEALTAPDTSKMTRPDAGEALFDRSAKPANTTEPVLSGYKGGANGPKTKTGDAARNALTSLVDGGDVKKALDALHLRGSELPRPVRQSLAELRELRADKTATAEELQSASEALVSDLRQFLGE